MRRALDLGTPDMFAIPAPAAPSIGGLDVGLGLRHLLSDLLKATPATRYQIAARMSELTGHEISKHQLDSWTAESREGWRFPLEYLPALEVALESHAVTAWLADLRGCTLLIGREALNAELGRLERMRDEAGRKIKQLKTQMGEGE